MNVRCTGVEEGYEGLIHAQFRDLLPADVSNIIHTGGTILHSSRSSEFRTEAGRQKAFANLRNYGVDALIIIGGDGSLYGAAKLIEEHQFPIIGIPKTIDNDIEGTDFAIGFDTAVNYAMQAVDRIKDTAQSHNRLFLVEVMGRNAGFIAWETGLATGSEGIIIPETEHDLEILFEALHQKRSWKKRSWIVVVAEGDETGGALALQKRIQDTFPELNTGVTILGHTQRGGSPTYFDRNLATRFGIEAVQQAINGRFGIMIGMQKNSLCSVPFSEVKNKKLPYGPYHEELLKILSL